MKKILFSLALSIVTTISFATNLHIDNVRVSSESSTIKWIGSKIASSHEGNVSIQKGTLAIDHGTLVGGEFSIDMNSIVCTDLEPNKGGEKIVKHLKNEDFFNVEEYPLAYVKIIRAVKGSGNTYKIIADLTIKGITKPITFQADVNVNGKNFLATANMKIDRTKWDIKYGSGSFFDNLGDRAILDEIEFDIYLLSVK
ncbi:YceI family protein [Flavobacteriales bacterium]|nr:YceI family protein [Flavobacteriales bacterium]